MPKVIKKEYEWSLTWSGMKDSPKLRGAVEACSSFMLFEDASARLVTHEEFMKLVEEGKIAAGSSYWDVEPGKVGLISRSHYAQFRTTWEKISTCKSDFERGWEMSEAFMAKQKTKKPKK